MHAPSWNCVPAVSWPVTWWSYPSCGFPFTRRAPHRGCTVTSTLACGQPWDSPDNKWQASSVQLMSSIVMWESFSEFQRPISVSRMQPAVLPHTPALLSCFVVLLFLSRISRPLPGAAGTSATGATPPPYSCSRASPTPFCWRIRRGTSLCCSPPPPALSWPSTAPAATACRPPTSSSTVPTRSGSPASARCAGAHS